jgi:hypothetical protein
MDMGRVRDDANCWRSFSSTGSHAEACQALAQPVAVPHRTKYSEPVGLYKTLAAAQTGVSIQQQGHRAQL